MFKRRQDGTRVGTGSQVIWSVVNLSVDVGLPDVWANLPERNLAFFSTAACQLMRVRDSGASDGYLSHRQAREEGLHRLCFAQLVRTTTASGVQESRYRATREERGLLVAARPLAMKGAPPLLSVGLRCTRGGMSWYWSQPREAFALTRQGQAMRTRISNDIPYHSETDPYCAPVPIEVVADEFGIFEQDER